MAIKKILQGLWMKGWENNEDWQWELMFMQTVSLTVNCKGVIKQTIETCSTQWTVPSNLCVGKKVLVLDVASSLRDLLFVCLLVYF